MLKRIRWMTVGALAGAGGSWWLERKVRAAVVRYLPEQVVDRLADQASAWQHDLRAALAEGRQAMRERQRELEAQLRPVARRRPAVSDDAASRGEGAGRHLRLVASPEGPAGR